MSSTTVLGVFLIIISLTLSYVSWGEILMPYRPVKRHVITDYLLFQIICRTIHPGVTPKGLFNACKYWNVFKIYLFVSRSRDSSLKLKRLPLLISPHKLVSILASSKLLGNSVHKWYVSVGMSFCKLLCVIIWDNWMGSRRVRNVGW